MSINIIFIVENLEVLVLEEEVLRKVLSSYRKLMF